MIEIRFIAEMDRMDEGHADGTTVSIKAVATVDGLASVTTGPLWTEVVAGERPVDAAIRGLECLFADAVSGNDFDDLRREFDQHGHGGPS